MVDYEIITWLVYNVIIWMITVLFLITLCTRAYYCILIVRAFQSELQEASPIFSSICVSEINEPYPPAYTVLSLVGQSLARYILSRGAPPPPPE
jgi:hypothetical protein